MKDHLNSSVKFNILYPGPEQQGRDLGDRSLFHALRRRTSLYRSAVITSLMSPKSRQSCAAKIVRLCQTFGDVLWHCFKDVFKGACNKREPDPFQGPDLDKDVSSDCSIQILTRSPSARLYPFTANPRLQP